MRQLTIELTLIVAVFLAIYAAGTAYRMDVTSAILGSLAVISALAARLSWRQLRLTP